MVPVLTEHVMLHHLPSLGSRLERMPGLADVILERYDPQPDEMLFVFSNSGVNQLPVAFEGTTRWVLDHLGPPLKD